MSTTFASPEIRQVMRHRMGQLGGIALALVAMLLLLALLSYNPHDPSLNTATSRHPSNWVGLAGAMVADVLIQSFGIACVLPVLAMLAWAWRLLNRPRLQFMIRLWTTLLALPAAATVLAAFSGPTNWPASAGLGGAIGDVLDGALSSMGTGLLGPVGGMVVRGLVGVFALVLVLLALGLTGREWRAAGHGAMGVARGSVRGGREAAGYFAGLTQRLGPGMTDPSEPGEQAPVYRPPARPAAAAPPAHPDVAEPPQAARPEEVLRPKVALPRKPPPPVQQSLPLVENGWQVPPLSLLKRPPPRAESGPTEETLQEKARLLESVLSDYGVQGTIREIRPGPVVTLYELEPAPGIRSARVIGLADDVARSLSVTAVRIATVPGRNVIGIEVPNEKRETVFLSELLETPDWRNHPAKLALALGKDISGAPVIADLSRMPHLLIAGTTGSGKSVGINAMILSLLFRMSPDQCRMIMIDPKMLELSVYEGIPHLLAPVVTEPAKAVSALKWTTREMERRYRAMSQLGVRNVGGYNEKVAESLASGKVPTRQVQVGFDSETGRPCSRTSRSP